MKYGHLNALDRKLVDEVAEHWVSGGGDRDGILFCLDAITERIQELTKEKEIQAHLNQ